MNWRPKAILFDVYGTLFDVFGVAKTAEALFPGRGAALAALWRDKQLAYTWLRTLSDRYADFWTVTGEALDYATDSLDLQVSAADRDRLMQGYLNLPIFPDAVPALTALRSAGLPLAVLSNGTPAMLDAVLQAGEIADAFDTVLSADNVRQYKTSSRAYELGLDAFRASPSDIAFVSSNAWDASGAAWFGYRVLWVNRKGLKPERLGAPIAREARTLAELPAWLGL